jgi:hypothetical protein
MDDQQRLMWRRMLDRIDEYTSGSGSLQALADVLRGLVSAADLHSRTLTDEFCDHFQQIDKELELRTEPWAPAGSASDEQLKAALGEFRSWAQTTLDEADRERA